MVLDIFIFNSTHLAFYDIGIIVNNSLLLNTWGMFNCNTQYVMYVLLY